MRKTLARTMIATLLLVSGVPMSAAKECAMLMPGAQAMDATHAMHGMPQPADQDAMHDMQAMHDDDSSMSHEHAATPAPEGRQAEIKAECCCSFHGLIDSLPHLLAPHMTSELTIPAEARNEADSIYVGTIWLARKARIPLPPPELLLIF